MTNVDFGKAWNRHIYLNEMLTWYLLPEEIIEDIKQYTPHPADAVALPADKFGRLMSCVRKYTDDSVFHWKLPAHNPGHFEAVRRNGVILFNTYYDEEAQHRYAYVRQALEIALYMHDCHHCGSTLRVDHQLPLHMPEYGEEVAVEYISALAAYRFLKKLEVPLPWRVFAVGVIWATTFGYEPAKARGFNFIPNIQPQTLYHALIRVADVHPEPEFKQFLEYSIKVCCGEVPADGKPIRTVDQYLKSGIGFLKYVLHSQDQLDWIASRHITVTSGFRQRVMRYQQRVQDIIEGNDPSSLSLISERIAGYPKG